jgi:hypothetical protein
VTHRGQVAAGWQVRRLLLVAGCLVPICVAAASGDRVAAAPSAIDEPAIADVQAVRLEPPESSTTVPTTDPGGVVIRPNAPLLLVVSGDAGVVVNLDHMVTAAGACHLGQAADGSVLPDPACTPGAVSTRVTQENLATTICTTGYTTTVRPSSSATNTIKSMNYVAYAQVHDARDENDHLVPLELGGANDPRNLWNEPPVVGQLSTTNPKDAVENALRRAVCAGRIALAVAQLRIARDWTTALAGL